MARGGRSSTGDEGSPLPSTRVTRCASDQSSAANRPRCAISAILATQSDPSRRLEKVEGGHVVSGPLRFESLALLEIGSLRPSASNWLDRKGPSQKAAKTDLEHGVFHDHRFLAVKIDRTQEARSRLGCHRRRRLVLLIDRGMRVEAAGRPWPSPRALPR